MNTWLYVFIQPIGFLTQKMNSSVNYKLELVPILVHQW